MILVQILDHSTQRLATYVCETFVIEAPVVLMGKAVRSGGNPNEPHDTAIWPTPGTIVTWERIEP